MPFQPDNKLAARPEAEQRTRRVMLQFTPEEKARLNRWAAGERLTAKMRETLLAALPLQ